MAEPYNVRFGPDGVHLFQRETGVNILMDEVVPPKVKWSLSPRQVSIALTNLCNLNCSHCYAPKSGDELEFDLLKSWLLELDDNGCFGVGFGGGEPTLYRNFAELCQFGAQNTNLAITFTTHGHTLTTKLVEKLKGNVHFIRVSMDGVGDNYESIRGKTFESLISSLALLKGQISYGVNFVVNQKTIGDLDAAADICESYSASELLLLPEVCAGLGKGIDEQSLLRLKRWVNSYRGTLKLSVSEAFKSEFNFIDPCSDETSLQSYAHVDATGMLKVNSFSHSGVVISQEGLISALANLKKLEEVK